MAVKTYLIRVTFENDNLFKVEQKIDGGNYTDILGLEENGAIHILWPGVRIACGRYFEHLIDEIVIIENPEENR